MKTLNKEIICIISKNDFQNINIDSIYFLFENFTTIINIRDTLSNFNIHLTSFFSNNKDDESFYEDLEIELTKSLGSFKFDKSCLSFVKKFSNVKNNIDVKLFIYNSATELEKTEAPILRVSNKYEKKNNHKFHNSCFPFFSFSDSLF